MRLSFDESTARPGPACAAPVFALVGCNELAGSWAIYRRHEVGRAAKVATFDLAAARKVCEPVEMQQRAGIAAVAEMNLAGATKLAPPALVKVPRVNLEPEVGEVTLVGAGTAVPPSEPTVRHERFPFLVACHHNRAHL